MFKFHRIALMGALLALGAAGCGDDEVTPVPTPDPLAAVFVPQSQSVAVSATANYALNITGGEGTADWTCAASPAPAAATKTATGCSASSTAAGSFLVTAVVTKGSESINAAASLTVTTSQSTPATVTISSINQGANTLGLPTGLPANLGNAGGQLDVILNIERGTEILQRVELRVGTTVVASQTLSAATAAEEDGPDGQAIQQITLSFNSACYTDGTAGAACGTVNATAGTAVIRHANGPQTINAQLFVTGGATSLRSSNTVSVNFANANGFHVITSLPTNSVMDANGLIWFGGPNSGATTITAIPIIYTSGTVTAVTATFCTAITDTAAPFTFAFTCGSTLATSGDPAFTTTAAGLTPTFTSVLSGNTGPTLVVNATAATFPFPVRVDNLGPGAPLFAANPNGRQNGWINASVGLIGQNTSATDNDWMVNGAADTGVGGYTRRLRSDATAPATVAGARAAAPSTTLPPPTVNNIDRCFLASAVDLLGNESTLPSGTTTCLVPPFDPYLTGANLAAVSQHIRGGIDIAVPTIAFVNAPFLTANERVAVSPLGNNFQVTVADTGAVGNSGMLSGSPVLARVLTRTITPPTACGGTVPAVLPGVLSSGVCTNNALGLTVGLPLVTTSGVDDQVAPAYFTIFALGRDAAGNSTAEVSRVVVRDNVAATASAPAVPIVITGAFTSSAFLNDDLSIRDYYWNAGFTTALLAPTTLRIAAAPTAVDAFDAATLTHTNFPVNTSINTFLGLQDGSGGAPAAYAGGSNPLSSVQLFVRDQTQAAYTASAAAVVGPTAPAAGIPIASTPPLPAAGGWAFTAYGSATSNATICAGLVTACSTTAASTVMTATATGTTATFPNPFSRVDFYAANATGGDLVLVGSVPAGSASLVDNGATRVWTYSLSVAGSAFYTAIAGTGASHAVNVYALGANAAGNVALVSAAVVQTVNSAGP